MSVVEWKLAGQTNCLTFLDIKLDMTHMIRRLPAHKLRELKEPVEWLPKIIRQGEGLIIFGRQTAAHVQGGPPRKNLSPKNVQAVEGRS